MVACSSVNRLILLLLFCAFAFIASVEVISYRFHTCSHSNILDYENGFSAVYCLYSQCKVVITAFTALTPLVWHKNGMPTKYSCP